MDGPALDDLVARIGALPGLRVIIGITGEPGAGKSTVAAALCAAVGTDVAVCVPMDGFHLARQVIRGTPLERRRGAPDTFDVGGYLNLLRRLRAHDEEVVYAPAFTRDLEDPIGSSIAVPHAARVVVTEGNYLLLDGPWAPVHPLLDEVWFVEVPDELRRARLIARHVDAGKDPEWAREWALGSDEANAALIRATRSRADLVVDWADRA